MRAIITITSVLMTTLALVSSISLLGNHPATYVMGIIELIFVLSSIKLLRPMVKQWFFDEHLVLKHTFQLLPNVLFHGHRYHQTSSTGLRYLMISLPLYGTLIINWEYMVDKPFNPLKFKRKTINVDEPGRTVPRWFVLLRTVIVIALGILVISLSSCGGGPVEPKITEYIVLVDNGTLVKVIDNHGRPYASGDPVCIVKSETSTVTTEWIIDNNGEFIDTIFQTKLADGTEYVKLYMTGEIIELQ